MYKRYLLFLLALCVGVLQLKAQNISNKGREFWLGYGKNTTASSAKFMIYISTEDVAKIEIYTHGGTILYRSLNMNANSVELIGPVSSNVTHMNSEGYHALKSIYIKSDVPITVFSHVYSYKSSGATMLMPVESYGYEYFAVCANQRYDQSNAWLYVLATENNTRVEITPNVRSEGGRAAGIPFTIDLFKGQIFQLIGESVAGTGGDLTGSLIKSVANAVGECHPVAVFSGNSRTSIYAANGGDYIQQQVFPSKAWGKKYITAPTTSTERINYFNANYYRVIVKNPATVVKVNGVAITGLRDNKYYEYTSDKPNVIEADQPVLVAQYIPSGYTGGINISGDLDPEMMIISPVEQAVNSVRFYNNNNDGIYAHYVTVIVPKVGLGSLRIDGGSAFDYSVVHPQNSDYQIVVKRWSQPGTHTVVCDTTFNAITYGMGVAESYGYNAGTNINNLNAKLQLNNSSESVAASYTCDGTDFKFSLKTTYKLAKLDLQLDTINNLLPKENIVIDNPVSTGTIIENDRTYNVYAIDKMLKFTKTGIYNVVAKLTAPEIEGCNFTEEIVIPIEVKEMPELDLSANPTSICSGNSITLNATASDVKSYSWAVGTSSYTTANPQHTFATIGEQKVKLNTIRASDGCMAADSITVKVNALPTAAFSLPDAICFPNGAAVFTNTSSFTNGDVNALTYNWNFGDGTTSATKDGNHVYSAIQNYTVRLTATSTDGCQSATTYTLPSDRFIAQLLSSTNFTDSTLCANNLIDFKGSANRTLTNAEYYWAMNNTVIQKTADLSYNFTTPGDYKLFFWLKTGDCLSDTTAVNVSVKYSPKADFTMTDKVCLPDTRIDFKNASDIAGASGEVSYSWEFGDGKTATTADAFNNYATNGNYFVKLTVDVAGVCSSAVEKEILETVFKPKLSATAAVVSHDFCTTVPVDFTGIVSGTVTQYYWLLGDGSTQNNGLTARKTYNTAGAYNIQFWAQSTDGCYSDTATIPVTIGWTPEVEAGINIVSTIGRQITLNGTTKNATSFSWSPDDKLNNAAILNPVTVLESDQLFYLNAVGNTGCEAYDSVLVKVYRELKVPNAFSPNGDGINDVWYLEGLEAYSYARLQIFDRYGNVVHTMTGAQRSWDGTRNGKPLPTGVYYYILTVNENEYGILKGSVALVR